MRLRQWARVGGRWWAGGWLCVWLAGCAWAAPDWSREVLYFVLVDRFADGDAANNGRVERRNPGGYHGGDFKGLTRQLGELQDLGVTALWINPVQRQMDRAMPAQAAGVAPFEHWGFHGYWIADFESMEPQFGSEAELKALVDEAHRRGIKVLLDVVYNHAGYVNVYQGRRTAAGEPWFRVGEGHCEVDPVRCAVGGLPDFRTELPEVRDYLLQANLGLARRVGVDGLRLDTYKHVETDFWLEHRRRTRAELGTDFFLLAEVWGGDAASLAPLFARDEVDSGFDFGFKGSCEGWVAGRGRSVAYGAYLRSRHQVRPGHILAHYLSSHDEPMALGNLRGDKARLRICAALQMASLGLPVVYYGEEVGRAGHDWPLNRLDMPWGERDIRPGRGVARDEALRAFYKTLIRVRRSQPALTGGDFTLLTGPQDPVLAFVRGGIGDGPPVLVLANRDAEARRVELAPPPGWPAGPLADLLAPADALPPLAGDGGRLQIELAPTSVRFVVSGSKQAGR